MKEFTLVIEQIKATYSNYRVVVDASKGEGERIITVYLDSKGNIQMDEKYCIQIFDLPRFELKQEVITHFFEPRLQRKGTAVYFYEDRIDLFPRTLKLTGFEYAMERVEILKNTINTVLAYYEWNEKLK